MVESSHSVSHKQQSVQTDDIYQPVSCRILPTNFFRALLLSPSTPLPQKSRQFVQSSHHPKAKLVLIYETSDCGKPIDQPCMVVDKEEKQARLIRLSADTSPIAGGISNAPKSFPFDAAFSDQDSTRNFCAAVLSDRIPAVVNGNDGCVIYLNHVGTRDVSRFVGKDNNPDQFGLIPMAIQWLVNTLNDQRSIQYYLTLSMIEVYDGGSKSRDLLFELKNANSPDEKTVQELKSKVFPWKRGLSSRVSDEVTELLATTVAEAAHYLDVAINASKCLHASADTTLIPSHLLFTLNVYRNRSGGTISTSGEMGHCQLNLIELMLPSESFQGARSDEIPTKNTSTVDFILNLISGKASLPFGTREPVLCHLLRKCLLTDGLVNLSLVIHTSIHPVFFGGNLESMQQISKIQYVWKHRSNSKHFHMSFQRRQNSLAHPFITPTLAQNTSSSAVRLRRLGKRMQSRRLGALARDWNESMDSASDLEYTSSSEQSCTTVIYLGRSHPLRKLSSSNRTKHLINIEKTETAPNIEEKNNVGQVPPSTPSPYRRFKNRSGHKTHGFNAKELWVDGPNASVENLNAANVETQPRGRSSSTSERNQSPENRVEKGHSEHPGRKLSTHLEKLKSSNDSPDIAKMAKHLETVLTPTSNRKMRKGDSILGTRQCRQMDQMQQTLKTAEFPVSPNWKLDPFLTGSVDPGSGMKFFVREWVESQNQAIAGCFGDPPSSLNHDGKQVLLDEKQNDNYYADAKIAETSQTSRKHRISAIKKQVDLGNQILIPIDSTSPNHILSRQVTHENVRTTHNQIDPSVDNLSRVARWVESVSTAEQVPPTLPKGCLEHPSHLCKNCNVTLKSPEISSQESSDPNAGLKIHQGAEMFHVIEKNLCQPIADPAIGPRKPDGASDLGLHRDPSFSSISGLDEIREDLKYSPLRKPVFRRFADLFTCSPSSTRHRRQYATQQHQSAPMRKKCVPFLGGVVAKDEGLRTRSSERNFLSVDSAGMLFTSLNKNSVREDSLYHESKPTVRIANIETQQDTAKHLEAEQEGRPRIKEAGAKHRFGFLQSPLFSKRSIASNVPSDVLTSIIPQPGTAPSFSYFHSNQQQHHDNMALNCQMVLQKSPHIHCHHKCVSQSSSSGLGSEHSEQRSLRCHCSMDQSVGRIRRCRMRTHRTRSGAQADTEEGNEAILLMIPKYTSASRGGHASSGYESVLRDDSELSSRSSSSGSYPWPPVGSKEAACQTMPFDLVTSSNAVLQKSPTVPEVLTASFTDTVTTSATGDTMLMSISSKTSGERTVSMSTSKQSPSGESRSSSLPSVRCVSSQRLMQLTAGSDPLKASTPQLSLNHLEVPRTNSCSIESSKSTWRHRRIAVLLQHQELLKAELIDAKIRLLADPGSWSFDLNVAEHMDPNDEGYLEALTDETELLQQRVEACRSHAKYMSFFQPSSPPPPLPASRPTLPPSGSHESPH